MKKSLFIGLMILTLAVSAAGCGNHPDEAASEAETAAGADTAPETIATEEMAASAQEMTETSSSDAEAAERPEAETTKAPISEEEAEKLLVREFGAEDEISGDKNVFTYEDIINVDGVDYYSYKWESGDGTYLCNAFVKKDGTDIMTGIYADGKWELGSDLGNDGDAGYDEEYYDDSDDAPYDDGFGDIDPGEEEPAEDDAE